MLYIHKHVSSSQLYELILEGNQGTEMLRSYNNSFPSNCKEKRRLMTTQISQNRSQQFLKAIMAKGNLLGIATLYTVYLSLHKTHMGWNQLYVLFSFPYSHFNGH